MAPDHPERGTRGIEQNAIERHAIPPRFRQRRIGADDLGVQCSALQIFTHPQKTLGVDVDGDQLGELRLALGDERSLAAGRRAGIEHPLSRSEPERKGNALRPEILHGNDALGKTGQFVHVARRIQCQRVRLRAVSSCAPRPASRSRCAYSGAVVRRLSTRSHIGAWRSPAASSCVQRTGQSARSRSASHTGEA